MKTDPISAAVTYRQYLQEISKAQTLHQARQAAARALQVEFHRPEPGQVSSNRQEITGKAKVTAPTWRGS